MKFDSAAPASFFSAAVALRLAAWAWVATGAAASSAAPNPRPAAASRKYLIGRNLLPVGPRGSGVRRSDALLARVASQHARHRSGRGLLLHRAPEERRRLGVTGGRD